MLHDNKTLWIVIAVSSVIHIQVLEVNTSANHSHQNIQVTETDMYKIRL